MVSFEDITFSNSSLHWIGALYYLLSETFYGATRIITAKSVLPEDYLSIAEKYGVTCLRFGPPHLASILKNEEMLATKNLSSIRRIIVGGCVLPTSSVQKFNSYLPNATVNNMYGCTEMIIITINITKTPESVGQLLSGCSVKIIDDKGNRCGIGMDGEICVKSVYKYLGYHRDPELTESVMDNDGFFHTGDIGRFDENGNLFIVGRKKELLAYPFYVSPHQIEEVLLGSSAIKMVCVVGVVNDIGYEFPAAVIVRAENSSITEDDVFNMVAGIRYFKMSKIIFLQFFLFFSLKFR